MMGLNLHYFWSLNVKQYMKYVRMYNELEKKRIHEIDGLNHILGKYISYAVNDPKKYPKQPYTYKDTNHVEMTDEEMEEQAIKNTIMMGGVVNDNRRIASNDNS